MARPAVVQVLGRLLGISDTILGLTILSWGGSLGGTLSASRWAVASESCVDEALLRP